MDKAAFLDKDGTIVEYADYSDSPKKEEILKDAIMEDQVLDGLKYLQENGFKLILISNQPYVSDGIVSYEEMNDLFNELVDKLNNHEIKILDYLYCPHKKSDACECRKPKSKLIFDAAKKHGINLGESLMIGDDEKDILAGQGAGTKTILVLTGKGKNFKDRVKPAYILKNLNEVIEIL